LLNHFFNEPDTLLLIDGSDVPELIYQRVDGIVTAQTDPLPAWVRTHLTNHFQPTPDATPTPPPASIDEARARYEQLKKEKS
jgi:hypothetical protein